MTTRWLDSAAARAACLAVALAACSHGAPPHATVSHEPGNDAPSAPAATLSRAPTTHDAPPVELTLSMCDRLVEAAKLDSKPRRCWEPCKGGGVLAPPWQLLVRGRPATGTNEPLRADNTYVQVLPQGCWDSDPATWIDACQVTRKDNVIELEPTFCRPPHPRGSGFSMAACLGGGWLECDLGHLEPGVYLVTTGRLHKCIQIPGTSHPSLDFVRVPNVNMAPRCGEPEPPKPPPRGPCGCKPDDMKCIMDCVTKGR